MTESSLMPPFSDEQKRQFCSMLVVGCDRETASKYLACTPRQLQEELRNDPEFIRQVLRAEGSAEFHQMRNLHEATKDSKQWRASVWWLERKSPERFAKRAANVITEAEWQQFIETLADAIMTQVTHEADRQRLLAYLAEIVQSVDADDQVSSVLVTPQEPSPDDMADDYPGEDDQP